MKTCQNDNSKTNIIGWIKNKIKYVAESPVIMSKYVYQTIRERIFSPKIYFQKVQEYYYWRNHKGVMETEWAALTKYDLYCTITGEITYNTSHTGATYNAIMLQLHQNRLNNLKVKKEELMNYNVQYYTNKKEEIIQMYTTNIDTIEKVTIPYVIEASKSYNESVQMKTDNLDAVLTEHMHPLEERAAKEREDHIQEVNRQKQEYEQQVNIERQHHINQVTDLNLQIENLKRLETVNANLERTIQDLNTRISTLDGTIEADNATIKTIRETNVRLGAQWKTTQNEFTAIREQNSKLQNQIDHLHLIARENTEVDAKLLEEKESTIKSLIAHNNTSKEKLKEARATNNLLRLQQTEIEKTNKQINKAHAKDMADVKRSLAETEKKVKLHESTIQQYEDNYALKTKRINDLREERDNLQTMCDSLSNNQGMTIMRMKAQLKTTLEHMQTGQKWSHDDFATLRRNYTSWETLSKENDILREQHFQADRAFLDIQKSITSKKDEYDVALQLLPLNKGDKTDKQQQKDKDELDDSHRNNMRTLIDKKIEAEKAIIDFQTKVQDMNKKFRMIHESNTTTTERIQKRLTRINAELTKAEDAMEKIEAMTVPQKPLVDIVSSTTIHKRGIEILKRMPVTPRNISKEITTLTPLHPITPELPSTSRNTTAKITIPVEEVD